MSSICSLNISLGVFTTKAFDKAGLVKINSKSIGGVFGRNVDKFFAGKDKRRCRFVATNGTLDAMIESSNQGQIDFYTKPENLLGDNLPGIEYSSPVDSENIYLGQFLDKPEARNDDSLGFIQSSELIVEFILIGFLVKLLSIFIFLLFELRKKNKRIDLKLKILKNFCNYRPSNYLLSKFNLIMIFCLLFNYLNLILVTNNIKTNEVILNLDKLIDTIDKLFQIDSYACWIKNSRWFDLVIKLDKNSLIYKIYQLKRKSLNDVCYLDNLINGHTKLNKLDLGKSFFIMNQPILLTILSAISRYQSIKRKIGFIISSIFDLELMRVHFVSSNLNYNLKSNLLKKVTDNFEFGFYINFYSNIKSVVIKSIKIDKLYDNVNDLKDDFIKISPLDLEYFVNLLILLFSFYCFILFIFIFKISHKFLIRKIVILIKKN